MLERKGDEARSIEYLEKSLELKPDYDEALNHLGYLWADKGINLQRARVMIEQALKAEPDNPAYLDSMGWVLFRRGDLEGAIRYLRKAFALRADVEIGVHLGEVLWQAGMQDEARQLWRDAREREPANEVLRETLVRLNITL